MTKKGGYIKNGKKKHTKNGKMTYNRLKNDIKTPKKHKKWQKKLKKIKKMRKNTENRRKNGQQKGVT